MKNSKRHCVIITGPTGVGKTAYSQGVMDDGNPIEIINGDMGQLYTPLCIGTAKPAWRQERVPHHLFDVIAKPCHYSVKHYRTMVEEKIKEIEQRNATPVIVGGSLFYLGGLLYKIEDEGGSGSGVIPPAATWQDLYAVDPVRAGQIHPHDTYRIERSFAVMSHYGRLASECVPKYNPISSMVSILFITRKRRSLYNRINERVHEMIGSGWIEEVDALSDPWKKFVREKKIIGYTEILDYNDGIITRDAMIATIQKKVCAYAKRQETAMGTLRRKIERTDNANVKLYTICADDEKDSDALREIIQKESSENKITERYDMDEKKEIEKKDKLNMSHREYCGADGRYKSVDGL